MAHLASAASSAPDAADNDSSGGSSSTTQTSDGDGEVPDAQENEADQKNDGPEQNEADEVDEVDEGPEQGETADDQSDGETNDDATDTGPDANPERARTPGRFGHVLDRVGLLEQHPDQRGARVRSQAGASSSPLHRAGETDRWGRRRS